MCAKELSKLLLQVASHADVLRAWSYVPTPRGFFSYKSKGFIFYEAFSDLSNLSDLPRFGSAL